MASSYSAGLRRSATAASPIPRTTASGVRSSCDESAVKRRNWSKDDSSLANVSLMTRGEAADFVSLVRDLQPFVQAFGRDSLRFRGKMIDRGERATRQQVAADAGKRDDQRQAEHENDQNLGELFTDALLGPRHPQHHGVTADRDRRGDRAPAFAIRDDGLVPVRGGRSCREPLAEAQSARPSGESAPRVADHTSYTRASSSCAS